MKQTLEIEDSPEINKRKAREMQAIYYIAELTEASDYRTQVDALGKLKEYLTKSNAQTGAWIIYDALICRVATLKYNMKE